MAISNPLIIYPITDANSFVSLTDADAILDYHINASIWVMLSDDDKKRRLINAYSIINDLEGFEAPVAPDPIPGCLDAAQALIAMQTVINDSDAELNRVKSERVGPMSTTYNSDVLILSDIPSTAKTCLQDYGVYITNTSVLSSMRKVR